MTYQPSDDQLDRRLKKVISEKSKEEADDDPTNADEFRTVNLAQDFYDDIAIVTVPMVVRIEGKACSMMFLITSRKGKLLLSDEILAEHMMYSEKSPSPDQRWSQKSIRKFIAGTATGDIEATFKRIVAVLTEYIDFGDPRLIKVCALWIIATYFHRMFEAFPYIHLNGNKASGKTKVLLIVSQLSFNGDLSAASTPAYIIRAIHDNSCTCCIDEAERLNKSRDDSAIAVMQMFLVGYKKGASVGKAEPSKSKKWTPKRYDAYAPKMFAGIKELDPTLASRCIPITMINSTDPKIKNTEVSLSDPRWRQIRDELYLVMMTCHEHIQKAQVFMQDDKLTGREWELWKPLLTIATVIDNGSGELYGEMRQLALEIQEEKKSADEDDTAAPNLLLALKDLLQTNLVTEQFYSTQQILEYLPKHNEEYFHWIETKHGRWLGNELRKAGIVKGRAKQQRVDGTNRKGYLINLAVIEERLKSFNN